MTGPPVFLDYNSTTPVHPQVIEAMQPYWSSIFGNPSSRHQAGQAAWRALETARTQIADLTQSHPDDVVFTSGATESNFLALQGRFEYLCECGCKPDSIRAAVSAVEHPCVMACTKKLWLLGARVDFIPVDSHGVVDLSFLEQHGPYDIIAIMTANHETGSIQPVAEAARIVNEKKSSTFFHTDAAQWAGRIEMNFPENIISSISLSAHKFYGPKGIGALILRGGNEINPLFKGSQEAGFRAGTVNAAGAVGMGKAAELMAKDRDSWNDYVKRLRGRLSNILSNLSLEIVQTVPDSLSLPQTLHVRFVGMKGERVADALDRMGLCCSPGPACASGASEASPVLMAMGLNERQAWEGVRFSLGKMTTEEEIEKAGQILQEYALRVGN